MECAKSFGDGEAVSAVWPDQACGDVDGVRGSDVAWTVAVA